MRVRCGWSSLNQSGTARDHVLPLSALVLVDVCAATFEIPCVHVTVAWPLRGSTAMSGASSKPYFHVGRVTRASGAHRPPAVREVTTRYGVSESPQNGAARNARSSRPSRPNATRGLPCAHEPPATAGPFERVHVVPPFVDS